MSGFESAPEHGTVVHLVKRLHFDDTNPSRRMMVAASARDKVTAPPARLVKARAVWPVPVKLHQRGVVSKFAAVVVHDSN